MKTNIAVFSILIIFSLMYIIYENNNSKVNKNLSIIKNMINDSIRLAEPRQWIINNLIAQNSPRIIIKNNKRLIFESLAFYDHINQTSENLLRNVKFLVLFAQNNETNQSKKLFLKIDEAIGLQTIINKNESGRFLWKLKREIEVNIELINLNKIVFLLTDVGEYKRLRSESQEDLKRLLTYHKPFIYDAREKKKPAIGHCVHMIRNLNERKLLKMKNWLSIQQRLGIDWIKLYFNEVDKKSEDEIREFISTNKGKMKIEIVNFGLFIFYFIKYIL